MRRCNDWYYSPRCVHVYLHEDGTLLVPLQNEVENIAIEAEGTHGNIYRKPTQLGKHTLTYSAEYGGWILTHAKKRRDK